VSSKKRSGFGSYPLRYLALGLLMKGPGHGYQLDQILADKFGMIWKAGQTKLYLTLSNLEKQGLLRIELEHQVNRPDRKVYHLTELGRKAFLDWVEQPVASLQAARVELLAKLRYFDWLELPHASELIQAQREIFQKRITEWEEDKAREQDPFIELVYDFRISQAQFIIEWLENYRNKLIRK